MCIFFLDLVQEDGRKSSVEAWNVPSMTFAIICRSCRDGVSITFVKYRVFSLANASIDFHGQHRPKVKKKIYLPFVLNRLAILPPTRNIL